MKSSQIEAKKIKPGDRLITEDGIMVTIISIGKGIPRNSIEFRWRGGFSAVNPNKIIERMV